MSEAEYQALLNYITSVRLKASMRVIGNSIPRTFADKAHSWADLSEMRLTDKQWFMLGFSSGETKVANDLRRAIDVTQRECNHKIDESSKEFLHRISEDSRWQVK